MTLSIGDGDSITLAPPDVPTLRLGAPPDNGPDVILVPIPGPVTSDSDWISSLPNGRGLVDGGGPNDTTGA